MLEGKHYAIDDKNRRIRLFNTQGRTPPSGFCEVKLSARGDWLRVGKLPERNPTTVLARDCLKELEDQASAVKIILNPLAAVRLFLEGLLTEQHFLQAKSDQTAVRLEKLRLAFPGVKIHPFAVVIAANSENAVMMLDSQGTTLSYR